MNSGELRIPYPVPVCVMGNLWLVKFNSFILQLMAKTNHKFPGRKPGRDTEFEVLLNSLYGVYTLKSPNVETLFQIYRKSALFKESF